VRHRHRSDVDADVRSPEADDVAGGNPLHGLTVRPADQGAAVTSTRARSAPDVPASETPTRLTVTDRVARGRAARSAVPRSAHREFGPSTDRFDPIAVLRAQDASRVTELVPIRYGRMAVSPFTFFRGAAAVMAADLAGTPVSGDVVQLCGDAHLSNFGFFASPERRLVFDLNDFDETLPGPWEWDVKRLAVSVEIAGRDRGFDDGDRTAAVRAVGRGYRRAMRRFAEMTTLEVWYVQADVDELRARYLEDFGRSRRKRVDRTFAKARTRDNLGALGRFTSLVDGMPRFTPDPPVVMPLRDLLPDTAERTDLENQLSRLLRGYHDTLPADRRALLDQYRPVDMARKVVGVGSVGTRSWMILLLGRDDHDALVLQAKEAGPSVLEEHLGRAEQGNHGERVVVGQQLMQAVSDIFLGWMRVAGIDSAERDFYIRQLRDWKGSFEIEEMVPRGLCSYADLCGWTLARAHARSGDRITIAGYLGSSDAFDSALVDFARAYADQNERDHRALLDAIAKGHVDAVAGI
jgi:uncharacterized protein (DUF2252 family)